MKSDDDSRPPTYVETDPTGRYSRFEEILGKGAMKTVYRAIDEVLGIEVAWNQIKLNRLLQSPDELQRLYSEVHLLSTLSHPSIIRFHTSWIHLPSKSFNFITELFTSGTLRQLSPSLTISHIHASHNSLVLCQCRYRNKYTQVSMRAIKSWARQVLEGLVYLHHHDPPVIHRDLKCDNIFVNGHLGQVKIGDLGLAAILRGSHSAHSVIGTPEFMAPELYEEDYNELVDVYSFGMCVLEMLTSEYPYSECTNPAQIYKKVTSGKLPGSFYRIQDFEAQRFIGKCLVSASKRLSAEELLQDSFLASEEAETLHLTQLGTLKPFLNDHEMERLHLGDDSTRTNMTITGKLNPEDDTIFLKVQIADIDGTVRNIFFPFDIISDTPIDVAVEMVKELEIHDWEPFEIADMIDGEISLLVPHWKKWDFPHHKSNHTFTYEEDHPFHSFSSCSSSQVSLSEFNHSHGVNERTHGSDWHPDDPSDETSSESSFHSATYSNLNYFSHDEQDSDHMKPAGKEQHQNHKCTRFGPEENSNVRQSTGRSTSRQCKVTMESQRASSSKKVALDSYKLTRNKSLVDVRSQLLHRSLVEEVNRRRLFKTVGAVENIGFQAPDVAGKASRSKNKQNAKGQRLESRRV